MTHEDEHTAAARRRASLVVAGAILGSCTPSPRPAAPTDRPAQTAEIQPVSKPVVGVEPEPEVDPDEVAIQALAPYARRAGDPHSRILYTWTTRSQAEQLRYDPVLLRFAEASNGPSRFDQRVASLPRSHTARKLLSRRGMDRRRFAWPHAWPTAVGWPGEEYGDALVRVEIQADSLVGQLDERGDWTFSELDGTPVSLERALDEGHRLVAVAHRYDPPAGEGLPFREYVLVNEKQIARWSFSDPDTIAKLRADLEALRRVRDAAVDGATLHDPTVNLEPWVRDGSASMWGSNRPQGGLSAADAWLGALALGSPRYQPIRESLEQLVDVLATRVEQQAERPPFEHNPDDAALDEFFRPRKKPPKPASRPIYWT